MTSARILFGVATIACGVAILWHIFVVTPPPPSPLLLAEYSSLLSAIESEFHRHALVMAPLHVEEDMTLHRLCIAKLTRDIEQLHSIRCSFADSSAQTDDPTLLQLEQRFQLLPFYALTAQALQRDHMMKELLREGWSNSDSEQPNEVTKKAAAISKQPDYLTPFDVEEFGRKFLLAPLEVLLSFPSNQSLSINGFDILRPRWLPHRRPTDPEPDSPLYGSRVGFRSVLEYAIERGLYAAVRLLIRHIRRSGLCSVLSRSARSFVYVHAQSDKHMRELFASEEAGVECLHNPSTVYSGDFDLKGIVAQPYFSSETIKSILTVPSAAELHKLDAGGWRQMPPAVSLVGLESISTRGCPFDRVSYAEMEYVDFRDAHSPIIITDAVQRIWSAVSNFTRAAMTQRWGAQPFEIGRIPYANLFASAADRVPLSKYFIYLDNLASEQQSTLGTVRTAQQQAEDVNLSPWYVFDGELFRNASMLQAGWRDTLAVDGSSLFHVPSPLRRQLDLAFKTVQASPQFFLGPASSGAPMHFHCPALNGLVFGRKHWFLYPQEEALYSKLHPKLFLTALARGDYPDLEPPFACTQEAGEMLFVPAHWSHATLNEHESIGVAVEFDVGGC